METDKRTVIGAGCTFDDGPVRPETFNSLPVFKAYSNYKKAWAFFGLILQQFDAVYTVHHPTICI